MALIPVAQVDSALEASWLITVLKDQGVDFRLELSEHSAFGVYMGAGAQMFEGYARVWAEENDAAAIRQALADIRDSQPMDEKDYLVNGRKWRIKGIKGIKKS